MDYFSRLRKEHFAPACNMWLLMMEEDAVSTRGRIHYCTIVPDYDCHWPPPTLPAASPHSTVRPPRRLRRGWPIKSAASMEQSPPPGAGGGEAKRSRKRSRYLSPPYTGTEVQVDDDGKEEPPPNICAADVLSALRAAALLSLDPSAAQALRFLALYRMRRRRRRLFANQLLHAPAAGVGHKPLLNLSTDATSPAPAMPTPAPGSEKKQKQNPQQPPPANTRKENAAALEAGQKRASQSDVADANFTVNAASNSAGPKRKRKRKNKKMMMNNTGQEHFRNPVALVLDFAQGTPLPSRDDLLSTFRRFGFVIDSETAIVKDHRSARVVFATRAEAEAAYSCAEILGTFGPPFAAQRLQDLPPITLNASPPVPKLPLIDVRKNLEKMILSLNRCSSSFKAGSPEEAKPAIGNLVGEMQGLLAKVDKMLQVGCASSTVHHH